MNRHNTLIIKLHIMFANERMREKKKLNLKRKKIIFKRNNGKASFHNFMYLYYLEEKKKFI